MRTSSRQVVNHLCLTSFLCLAVLTVSAEAQVEATISDTSVVAPTSPPTKPDSPNVISTPAKTVGLVPGTGYEVEKVGDDFEDPNWSCTLNLPKSSSEADGQKREPGAFTSNQRWYEGAKRGIPDQVERIETPAGGLPNSTGALLLRSLQTGIPGRLSYVNQQDDFVCDVDRRLGGAIPVSQSPSVVVRVYMPPFETWERRKGAHFGFRLSLLTTKYSTASSSFTRFASASTVKEKETYWPGMFIELTPAQQSPTGKDQVNIRIRGNNRGYDFEGPVVANPGWWTLGMSVTPDGDVHYFAKPGVEDLTAEDHITSQTPYSYKAEHFKTFFFNVVNGDNGKTWSTPFVIDDPKLYFVPTR